MPYIKPENRGDLIPDGVYAMPQIAGELNYMITKTVHDYIEQQELSYATINEAIEVLECAKLELYRMIAAPYENKKWKENGHISNIDVSHPDIDNHGRF